MFRVSAHSHISLMVADVEQSAAFYRDVLGMTEVPRPRTFDFAGKWFRAGSAEIHLIASAEGKQPPGDAPNAGERKSRARHFAFEVAGMDETLAHLRHAGIPIHAGPQERGDGALQVYVFDPDGHLIELCTPATGA